MATTAISFLSASFSEDPSAVKLPFWLKNISYPKFDPVKLALEMSTIEDMTDLTAMTFDTVMSYGPQIDFSMENITHRTEDLLLECMFNDFDCDFR